MKARWIAVLLLSLFVTAIGAVPATATTTETWWRYRNVNSGYCLAVPGDSTTNGVKLIVWDCNGGGQLWRQVDSNTWENVYNVHGKCLSIPGGSETRGVQAILWTCANTQERLWDDGGTSDVGGGTIVNYKSRMCLAVSGGSGAQGAAVIQWTCNSGPEQNWIKY
jgi:hypothetical protein